MDDTLDKWLDKKAKDIVEKLDEKAPTTEDMIILMLKYQTNHIVHLDNDLRQQMINLDNGLQQKIVKLDNDLKQQMINLESDLRQQMINLDNGLQQQMIELRKDMDKRFEQVDKRFEQVDKRFEDITKRIDRFMVWSLGLVLAVMGFMKFVV